MPKRKRKVARRKVAKRKVTKKVAERNKAQPNLKVFISWSGSQSECLGNRLGEWLPGIVPDVEPFFSPNIAPGAVWAQKFEEAIQKADYAILCVTKDNLDSRWMNFEAGALWRTREESYVCPLLLNLKPAKLAGGPYTVFQARQFDKKDFKNLCEYLANKTGLNAKRFELNFEANWPNLLKGVRSDLKKLRRKKR